MGRYRVLREIGRGGMGAVFEAVHVDLEKRVALKALLPSMTGQPDVVARFEREGRAMAKIRHPNVVDVSDVGAHDGVPFLVMEFLEGEDLARLLLREGALSAERAAEIMLPVLGAVAAAHARGIIHRDLKPENIFLARAGDGAVVPKVLDFGISKIVHGGPDSGLTETGMMIGTTRYMSPEQVTSARSVDARSDQFTLGVILYQCVTGSFPFTGETLFMVLSAIVSGRYERPTKLRPDLPPAFEAMLDRALRTAPDDRFPSVLTLADALRPFADARDRAAPAATAVTLVEPAPSRSTPPPAATAAESLALADTFSARSSVVTRAPAPRLGRGIALAVAALTLVGVAVVVRRHPAVAPAVHAAVRAPAVTPTVAPVPAVVPAVVPVIAPVVAPTVTPATTPAVRARRVRPMHPRRAAEGGPFMPIVR